MTGRPVVLRPVKLRSLLVTTALVAVALAPARARAQSCPAGKVALVLPGGGVLGIAHVGVMQVMDSLGIVPDLVVGTSMGAITGALYASGYTGRQIDSLARDYNFGPLIGKYAPRAPRSLGPNPPLIIWEQGDSSSLALQTSAVREGEVNTLMAAMLLRGNLLARGDFDSLPIPFRAVAAELQTGKRVILSKGDLAQAVRASFAIPLVFKPVIIDGLALVDGGLAENAPVRAARELGATRVILSRLVPRLPPADPSSYASVALKLVDYLFQANPPVLQPGDVDVQTDVSGYANLDFSDAAMTELVARGRQAALQLADDPCLPRRPRRHVPLRPLAHSVVIGASNATSRRVVVQSLMPVTGVVPDVPALQRRMRDFGESEFVRGIWLNPQVYHDSIVFAPLVERAPHRALAAGLVYDQDLGGSVWVGGVERGFASRNLEASVRTRFGTYRQEATAGLRPSFQLGRTILRPFGSLTVGMEDIRLFDSSGVEVPLERAPEVRERIVQGGAEQLLGKDWTLRLAATYRAWSTRRGDSVGAGNRDAFGALVRIEHTADRHNYGGRVELDWTNRYRRVAVMASRPHAWGAVHTVTTLHLGWTSRGAPLTARFTLGDKDGFAGFRIGEKLAYTQGVLQSDVGVPLRGPLHALLTVMGGQVSGDPARPLSGTWYTGTRLGLGADSPLGPLRLQYGVNSERRTAWYFRIGRWF